MPIHTHCRAAFAAVALVAAGLAQAGSYTVTTTADGGPGSLRQVLADLPPDEDNEIRFQPGGTGVIVLSVASDLPLLRGTSVLIEGQYNLGGIVVDGQSTSRLFFTGNVPTTVRNLTVRNGASTFNAGCVQGGGAALTLENVAVEGCRAGIGSANAYGGGVSGFGSLTVRRSIFRDNLAMAGTGGGNQAGGAIYYRGQVLIEDSLFVGNRVENGPNFFSDGGAAYFLESDVTVRRSRFIDNRALAPVPDGSAGGGAIACRRGTCTIESSYFGGNDSAMVGGAVAQEEGALVLRNVVVQDTLGGYGGAVRVTGAGGQPATLTIDNSTFTDNAIPAWSGYGVHLDVGGNTTVLRIANTAFGAIEGSPACRLAGDAAGYAGPGFNRAIDGSCDAMLGIDSAQATVEQFGLGAPVFGGYVEVPQLSATSVLIDAGNPATPMPGGDAGACLTVDANSHARPSDGDGDGIARCDIGAQEIRSPRLFGNGFET